jgi:predicted nucleic acid-binding protein
MNVLVDSSVWIEYFKGAKKYLFINDLIDRNVICTNDIILTKLLPSIMHKKEHKLAELLNYMNKYTLNIDWQEIRNIQLLNMKHGNNNIGISDIIIAQNSIQNDLAIAAHDKHFAAMARYIPVKIYR